MSMSGQLITHMYIVLYKYDTLRDKKILSDQCTPTRNEIVLHRISNFLTRYEKPKGIHLIVKVTLGSAQQISQTLW